MAKRTRVYGFDEQGFRRVQEATRIVLGTPRVGSQRTARQPVLSAPGGTLHGGTAGFWTIAEYDAVTGDIVHTFDRGNTRTREIASDVCLLLSSDGIHLYAASASGIGAHSGYVIKWNIDTGARVWESADGSLNSPVPSYRLTAAHRVDGALFEASDGAIWLVRGAEHNTASQYAARLDPDTGAQTHEYAGVGGGFGSQILDGGSGSVIIVSIGLAELRVLDATATSTAALTSHASNFNAPTCVVADGAGNLIVVRDRNIGILNATTLADVTTSTALPVGETFQTVATDGTTIWTASSAATNKYRAFNFSLVEQWNANRDNTAATSWRMITTGGNLYDFAGCIRKINPASGAEVWQSSPTTGFGSITRAPGCALGSDFTISTHPGLSITTNQVPGDPMGVVCCEEATGVLRWFDNVTGQAAVVTPDDRVFVCHTRRGDTLLAAQIP